MPLYARAGAALALSLATGLLVAGCGDAPSTSSTGSPDGSTAITALATDGIVLPEGLSSGDEIAALIDSYDNSPVHVRATDGSYDVTWYPGDIVEGSFLGSVELDREDVKMLVLGEGTTYQYHTTSDLLMGVTKPGWYVSPGKYADAEGNSDLRLQTFLMLLGRMPEVANVNATADGYELELELADGMYDTMQLTIDDQRALVAITFNSGAGALSSSEGVGDAKVEISYLPEATPPPAIPGDVREYDNTVRVEAAGTELDKAVQELHDRGMPVSTIDHTLLNETINQPGGEVEASGGWLLVQEEFSYSPSEVAVEAVGGTLHAVISDGKATCTHLEWAADGTYTNHGPVAEGAMSDNGWTCSIS